MNRKHAFTLGAVPDTTEAVEMQAATDAADLIIVPESVNSIWVRTKLSANADAAHQHGSRFR